MYGRPFCALVSSLGYNDRNHGLVPQSAGVHTLLVRPVGCVPHPRPLQARQSAVLGPHVRPVRQEIPGETSGTTLCAPGSAKGSAGGPLALPSSRPASLVQIWRPVTAVFFYPMGFHYLVNLYFLYTYSIRLETGGLRPGATLPGGSLPVSSRALRRPSCKLPVHAPLQLDLYSSILCRAANNCSQ